MKELLLADLLKSGVHFGHKKSRWHPKMAKYIYGTKGGFHIVDLEKTKQAMLSAAAYMESIVKKDGLVLFIATKPQAQEMVKKYALDCHMPYVSTRYLGGLLTNFVEIRKLIRKYKNLVSKRDKGELKKYTKKEQLDFDREIKRLEDSVGGIVLLEKMPDALFVIDIKHEKGAVLEAKRSHIPVVAICDTNVNPELVTHVIPGNDDAVRAIEFYLTYFSEVIKAVSEKRMVEKAKEKQVVVPLKKVAQPVVKSEVSAQVAPAEAPKKKAAAAKKAPAVKKVAAKKKPAVKKEDK